MRTAVVIDALSVFANLLTSALILVAVVTKVYWDLCVCVFGISAVMGSHNLNLYVT